MPYSSGRRSRNTPQPRRRDRTASKNAIETVIAQIDAILDTEPMDSVLIQSAMGGGHWVPLGPEDTLARVAHDRFGDARKAEELAQLGYADHIETSVADSLFDKDCRCPACLRFERPEPTPAAGR